MKNTYILFYTEYTKNGRKHYSVSRYNYLTGIVEYPTDNLFDTLKA